ncbi:MAG TPA: hypothetical protein PK177_04840 [Burkholderiaceae bacterium]|nr:hypothetical protein [Burkholderiaceae bacterium]
MYRKKYQAQGQAGNPRSVPVVVARSTAPTAEELAWDNVYERANHAHQARALVELFRSQPGLATGREALFIKASLCVHEDALRADRKRAWRMGLRRLIDWLLPVDAAQSVPAGLPAPQVIAPAPPLYAARTDHVSRQDGDVDLAEVDASFEPTGPTPARHVPEKDRTEAPRSAPAPAPRTNLVDHDDAAANATGTEAIPGATPRQTDATHNGGCARFV